MKTRNIVALALLPLLLAAAPKTPMSKPIAEAKMQATTFGDALDYLRDATGANIHVNWKAIELVGVDKSTPVDLRLSNVTLRKALQLLLTEAAPDHTLAFYSDEGVIEITTQEMADKSMITRVYDVQDLLMEIPDFVQAPNVQSQSATTIQPGAGGGAAVSNSTPFGNSTNTNQVRTRADRETDLIKLIEDTIRPEIWRDNGGTASIRMFNGHLIVTAPRSVHEKLGWPVD